MLEQNNQAEPQGKGKFLKLSSQLAVAKWVGWALGQRVLLLRVSLGLPKTFFCPKLFRLKIISVLSMVSNYIPSVLV